MSRLGSASTTDQGTFDEYVLTVPKNSTKKYNVMRFSGGDKMDVQQWAGAQIKRDLSAQKIYQDVETFPEFGAGSEYGRKQKQQARRLKYGMRKSKFDADNQPWQLSVNTTAKAPYSAKNKNKDKMITVTKEFAGKKEGGIGDSSMYFVFMQRPNSTFEAYPVESWYSFTRKIKHRTLTDEEAEAEWDKRDKIMNHLNFMARKRLKLEEEQDEDEDKKKPGRKTKITDKDIGKHDKKSNNGLVIHDEADDELLMSESEEDSDEDKVDKDKKIKKKVKKEAADHDEAPEEGLEESDDGDGEGEEQDYNSDISSEEENANDSRVAPKGLDEQESSSSSEEEETKPDDEKDKKQKKKKGSGDEVSTSGESEVDSDIEKEGSALFVGGRKTPTKGKKGSGGNSRSSTPNTELLTVVGTKNKLQEVAKRLETTGQTSPKVAGLLGKRHAGGESSDVANIKRQKITGSGTGSGSNTPSKDSSQNLISEESVRRYLEHKPITTKDLLKKFKSKKTGLSSEQMVNTVARILKRLNPEQKKISGKIHLFLKQS